MNANEIKNRIAYIKKWYDILKYKDRWEPADFQKADEWNRELATLYSELKKIEG